MWRLLICLLTIWFVWRRSSIGVYAADDYTEHASDYSFIYHDNHKLLLAVHGDDCYYVPAASVPEEQLTTANGKIQLEIEVVQKIRSNEGSATTLAAMRDKYSDILADYHCLDKNVYTLLLMPQDNRPQDGVLDCSDIKRSHPDQGSGVHTLYVHDHNFTAFCDQATDGGGWTVWLKRYDGSGNFWRQWNSFEHGFGLKRREYWLGLWYLHALTSSGRNYELRVDIGDYGGSTAYAVYNVFRVDGPDTNYVLHVTGYHGTAGDSLDNCPHGYTANGMRFTTPDRDHDNYHSNCASEYHNSWWHNNCYYTTPLGPYHPQPNTYQRGMTWVSWHHDFHRSFKSINFKIRPRP